MSISTIMTPLADAVRLKTDNSGQLTIAQMTTELNAIPERSQTDITVDGPTVSIPQGNYKSAANVEIPTVPQATPTIRVNDSGVISVTANQEAGYVVSGNKVASHQLQLQPGATITPTKASQVAVHSGYFTGGSVIVAGDQYLDPQYIVSGVSIFGVGGTYTGLEDTLVSRALTSYSNSRVSYIGSYAFASASLKTVSFNNCKAIQSGAFRSCAMLTSVSFPECKTIGASAFDSCTSLSTIYFPKCTIIGSAAFYNCDNLSTASFSLCRSIYNDAFYGAGSITAASFPQCVTLGAGAFQSCPKLSTAYFPKAESIPNAAFSYCSSLTNVVISSASTIGAYAFTRCNKLTSIAAPSCVSLYYGAFMNCSTLTSVELPLCTYISMYAFSGCNSLSSIELPSCLELGSTVFQRCSNLTSVNLPQCTTVGSSAFVECSKLTSVNLPVCTKVDQSAFYSCRSLTSFDLPECTSLGSYAFSLCSRLSNIALPKCSWIGDNAFNCCYSLTTVSLPSCEWLGNRAFGYCSKLSSIYLAGSKLCNLYASSVFIGAGITSTKGSIYVPLSIGWDYKTATNWTYFSNRIFSIEGEEIVKTSMKFNIDGTEYTAKMNSTWEEWISSDYNTDDYQIANSMVVDAHGSDRVESNFGIAVSPSDVIVEGASYDISPIPLLAQFTIDGVEYNAEEHMMWDDWIQSGYNTAGYKTYQSDFYEFILTSDESRYIIEETEYPDDPERYPDGFFTPMSTIDEIVAGTTYFTIPFNEESWI